MADLTKKAIAEGLKELCHHKDFNKISVRDITEQCGLNRQTFYYHFQDIPALIEEIFIEESENLIKKYPKVDDLDACVDSIFQLSMKNKKALLNIFHSVNRDIYEQYTMRLCETFVTKYVYTVFGQYMINERDRKICIWSIKCELFGILIDCCTNGLREDYIDDIHRLLELSYGIPQMIIKQSNERSANLENSN